MKWLFVLLFSTSSFYSLCQDLATCEKLMDYQYTVIDSLPLNKIELYQKSLALIADWYPGYPSVVQMADSNSGVILISGINNLTIPTGYKKQTVNKAYTHRMKIECRDNKVRVGIYFQTIVEEHSLWLNARQNNPKWISEKEQAESLIRYAEQCNELQTWIETTINSFKAGLMQPAEDW